MPLFKKKTPSSQGPMYFSKESLRQLYPVIEQNAVPSHDIATKWATRIDKDLDQESFQEACKDAISGAFCQGDPVLLRLMSWLKAVQQRHPDYADVIDPEMFTVPEPSQVEGVEEGVLQHASTFARDVVRVNPAADQAALVKKLQEKLVEVSYLVPNLIKNEGALIFLVDQAQEDVANKRAR